MVNIKEFGRNSSFCGILYKIMESVKEPISCEEISVHALEAWGRGFPRLLRFGVRRGETPTRAVLGSMPSNAHQK